MQVGRLPVHLARLICQRAAVWWDMSQRRKYAGWLIAIVAILAVGIVAVVIVCAFLGINFAREVALIALDEKGVALTEKSKALSRETEARDKADQSAEAAVEQTRLANLHLYAAHLNLAQNAAEAGYVGIMRDLLQRYAQDKPNAGLRGFEWHYWDRLCHSYQQELKGHKAGVICVEFRADGDRLASAGHDGTVLEWDTVAGTQKSMLHEHTLALRSVAFSP